MSFGLFLWRSSRTRIVTFSGRLAKGESRSRDIPRCALILRESTLWFFYINGMFRGFFLQTFAENQAMWTAVRSVATGQ